MSSARKFILSVLTLFAFLLSPLLSLSSVSAQIVPTPCPPNPLWYDQDPCNFREKVTSGDPAAIFGERYTYAQVNWIINSILLMLQGSNHQTIQDIIDLFHTFTADNSNPTMRDFAQLGLPGILVGGISEVYTHPPASGVQYLAGVIDRFNFGATPAYAQGYGFTSLSAVQVLWGASRNLVYLIMIILLVAAGFMIMFRVKINPQTAVTLQIMIPKIIISLLAVTFSYAIAGLVIDMIYVVISFVIAGLYASNIFGAGGGAANYFNGGLPGIIGYFTAPKYSHIVGYFLFPIIVLVFFLGGIATIIATFVTAGAATLITGTVSAILGIIVIIVLIWLLFRIWWMLLKTYITLMFLIIIGPWQIMLGLLPGQQGLGSWLKSLIAQASVFVTVPLMFMLVMIFWRLDAIPVVGGIAQALTPFMPFDFTNHAGAGTGTMPELPLMGWGSVTQFFFGYAILAMMPKIADMIRDALKVPAFKYGSAFGEVLNMPYGAYSRFVGSQQTAQRMNPKNETQFMSEGLGGQIGRINTGINNWRASRQTGTPATQQTRDRAG